MPDRRHRVAHSAAGTTTHTTLVASVVSLTFQKFPGLLATINSTPGHPKLTYQLKVDDTLQPVTDWPTSGTLTLTMLPGIDYRLIVFDTEFMLHLVPGPAPASTGSGQLDRLEFLGFPNIHAGDPFVVAYALSQFQADNSTEPTGEADATTQALLVRAARV